MDRGLCRLPDTHQPTYSPLAPITLFLSVSLQSSSLPHSRCSFLALWCSKKLPCQPFEKSRWNTESSREEDNLSRASAVYLLRAISFSSQPHTHLVHKKLKDDVQPSWWRAGTAQSEKNNRGARRDGGGKGRQTAQRQRAEHKRRQREKGKCEGENDMGERVYAEPHGVLKHCHPAAQSQFQEMVGSQCSSSRKPLNPL